MSKGIIRSMSKVAEPAESIQGTASDEQPTLADLVLPGTGYKFSDEVATILSLFGEEGWLI